MNPQGGSQMAMMQQQHFRQQQNPQMQQATYNMGHQPQIRMNHPGVPQNIMYQQSQLQQQHLITEEHHQMNLQRYDFLIIKLFLEGKIHKIISYYLY